MKKGIAVVSMSLFGLMLSGCETTNSIPYKASTSNVISIQQTLGASGAKVLLGDVKLAEGVSESPMCRLNGPIKVAPGKTIPEYVKDAFQEELFMAKVYDPSADTVINGRIENLSFSSVAPANWEITMKVSSNKSQGYVVDTKYPFETSWSAYSACKNVADAFGPAVQNLLQEVVTHPEFPQLTR